MDDGLSENEAINFFKKTAKKLSDRKLLNKKGKEQLRNINVDSKFSSDMFNFNGMVIMGGGTYKKFLDKSNGGKHPDFDLLNYVNNQNVANMFMMQQNQEQMHRNMMQQQLHNDMMNQIHLQNTMRMTPGMGMF